MPKNYFKPEHMTSLGSVPESGHIYLIGICGVAMGQLAVALANRGYRVSGSDKEFYEPMGTFLKKSQLTLYSGYSESNLTSDIDLVVIGNAISYGHPEVDVVERQNLPYTCFPKLLHETIIDRKHSIAVCGTHGKSTTTAMIAHTLLQMKLDPSYFIGGVVDNLPTSLKNGSGQFSVVEGDEYDDVFFSKQAKFMHYKPETAIINAIEFDHADLYENVESIVETFDKLIASMTKGSKAICCIDFPEVAKRISEWRDNSECRIITFGASESADYRIVDTQPDGLSQIIRFSSPDSKSHELRLPVPGLFNARNALAATIACYENGLDLDHIMSALGKYSTVKRRQEVRYQDENFILIEDFAHHPTAVKECLLAIRSAFPDKKIQAIFEPRSNTSRRAVFREAYVEAFEAVDSAILCEVTARSIDSGQDLLDVKSLARDITDSGSQCVALPNAEDIAAHVLENLAEVDVVVVMSNGAFGGLIEILLSGLKK